VENAFLRSKADSLREWKQGKFEVVGREGKAVFLGNDNKGGLI